MKDAARRILHIVRDGTILTASGREATEAFGAALVQLVRP
jgi:hypothetical protein